MACPTVVEWTPRTLLASIKLIYSEISLVLVFSTIIGILLAAEAFAVELAFIFLTSSLNTKFLILAKESSVCL